MRYNHVLFDLDGTLCDPGPGITDSVAFALEQIGIVEADAEVLRSFVGPPLQHSFKEIYHMDDASADKAVDIYRDRFKQIGIHEYTPYPGIESLLKELQKQNVNMAVATSKIEPFALQVLESVKLFNYFSFISADLPQRPKLKAETIQIALNHFKLLDKSGVVMVGDKEHDIIGANANNIDSIGVTYGYGSEAELLKNGATQIVKDVGELSAILLK